MAPEAPEAAEAAPDSLIAFSADLLQAVRLMRAARRAIPIAALALIFIPSSFRALRARAVVRSSLGTGAYSAPRSVGELDSRGERRVPLLDTGRRRVAVVVVVADLECEHARDRRDQGGGGVPLVVVRVLEVAEEDTVRVEPGLLAEVVAIVLGEPVRAEVVLCVERGAALRETHARLEVELMRRGLEHVIREPDALVELARDGREGVAPPRAL